MASNSGSGNKDAQFRFAMSEDGMKLGVSRYFPPNGGEGPSVELLRRQVSEAGVQLPMDERAAKQVIDAIQRDGEIRRIVLVHGIKPQEPTNAQLMALGDLNFPVFAGDRFARKNGPFEARDGQTIDGRSIKTQEDFEPEDIEIELGENVEFDPLDGAYVAQRWGLARFKDGVISVDPIPVVSEDAIFVRGNLHAKDFKGRKITPAQIEKELRDLGVVIDIDSEALDDKLNRARATGDTQIDEILVEGKHPVPGKDGWFEFLIASTDYVEVDEEAMSMDFRDRSSYPMAETGQIIGRLHEPEQGQGGIDIYGKTIPASGGNGLTVHLGSNVLVHDDKLTFEAKAKGVVSFDRHVLAVTDCLLISGDVDMTTGNVKLDHGSVKILGSIQAGFTVTAPKDIIVGGSVESAKVVAGGNIEVSGGILMPEGGIVQAEGDVGAGYTNNARIVAGGDVRISNEVSNTSIQADGKLYAVQGKGHIQGGRIVTAKGIVANEIGTDLGVKTIVAIRIEDGEDHELKEQRDKVKAAISRIDDTLGKEPAETILSRTPPEKRAAVAEVLKHRHTLVKRRKALSEDILQLSLKRQEELAGLKIRAKRCLHPGALLYFGARGYEVKEYMEKSVFFWNESTRSIEHS